MSSLYFQSRAEAGQKLLPPLLKYRFDNTAVVALGEPSVLVAEQVAASLHCIMTLLIAEDIEIPGESLSYGGITAGGAFSVNAELGQAQANEYYAEFRGYIEEQKRMHASHINRLLGDGGMIDTDMLRDHVIILVSDGLKSGGVLDTVAEYLKPVRYKKLVIAAPVVSVPAVDRAHILGDELDILSVTDNYMDTDHYYTDNTVPAHEGIVAKINETVLHWR